MTTIKTKVKNLKAGMVVVNLYTRTQRTLTTDAMKCKARGYYRAETNTREPVNSHGDDVVEVLA